MNKVKAGITSDKCFEKYCTKCVRQSDCIRIREDKRCFALRKETVAECDEKERSEDIEHDFQRCYEFANGHPWP